jgi:Skp family chaperone for outer membrane proteins
MKRSRLGSLLFITVLFAGAAAAFLWHQSLVDWWRLHSYSPPGEIQQLADNDHLTSYARRVFYVAHPAVEDRASFNAHCKSYGEKTIVLGCYDGRGIYVYNVTNNQLAGVKEVTAAHEMLHAAYNRLSKSEKQRINSELEQQLATLHDPHIDDLVEEYKKSEPGELDNELHSILGTEVTNLNPTLEQYYKKYFTNRGQVANYAHQYESVFTKSEAQIAQIDSQLTDLRAEVDHNQSSLANEQSQLQSQSAQMEQLKLAGDLDTYNQRVNNFNTQVQQFNSLLARTKQQIANYNQLVATRNSLATVHNNLAQSLNSNLTPLTTQ